MYTTVVRHLQLQRLAQERWTEETGANLGMPCTTYILLWRTVPSLPVWFFPVGFFLLRHGRGHGVNFAVVLTHVLGAWHVDLCLAASVSDCRYVVLRTSCRDRKSVV